jgi:hypothetical protein
MKQITLFTILICISVSLFSNDTISYNNKIDFSFSNIQFEDGFIQLNDIWVLQLDYNRNINNYISVGGYGGFGMYDEWIVEREDYSTSYTFTKYRYCTLLGLNSKLHLLPLIFKPNIPRFDLYISGNLGLISMFTSLDDNISPERGHYFDYSFMGGGTIYLSKKLGLFIEAGYREFKYHKGFNAKYGLTYRF